MTKPATGLEDLTKAAQAHRLDILGTVVQSDGTTLLLGPKEPGFWAHVTAAPEFNDAAPDPLDRWSKRIILALAKRFDAKASFPSDGPPYPPFISWALASGRAWASPVGMLVQDTAGLFVSYRGALHFRGLVLEPSLSKSPCSSCAAPCATACPVNALSETRYNVDACKAHILGADSMDCRTKGCAARRACPLSQSYGRLEKQSAFHMRAFLGE